AGDGCYPLRNAGSGRGGGHLPDCLARGLRPACRDRTHEPHVERASLTRATSPIARTALPPIFPFVAFAARLRGRTSTPAGFQPFVRQPSSTMRTCGDIASAARQLLLTLGLGLAGGCATFGGGPSLPPLLDPDSEAMQAVAPDRFKVLFETTEGDFVLEAYREWAPLGTDRFYNLVRHGFYDGARFFRVLPGFVVQFGLPGDPALTEIWSERRIEDDPVVESNVEGYVSFATAGPGT